MVQINTKIIIFQNRVSQKLKEKRHKDPQSIYYLEMYFLQYMSKGK